MAAVRARRPRRGPVPSSGAVSLAALIEQGETVAVVEARPTRVDRYRVMERRDVRDAVEFEFWLVTAFFAVDLLLLGSQSATFAVASFLSILAMLGLVVAWRLGTRRRPHSTAFAIGVVIITMGVVSATTTPLIGSMMSGLFAVVVVGCAAWMPWSARWHTAFLGMMAAGALLGLAFSPIGSQQVAVALVVGTAALVTSASGAALVRKRRMRAWTASLELLRKQAELRRAITELETAQGRIRRLEGILPICSSCKRIRDGEAWERLEAYVSGHSDATFSHGICPQCAGELYGDLADA